MRYFRQIFDEKQKACEILLQKEIVSFNSFLFLKHDDRGKAHEMTESHCMMKIERYDQKASREPDLDWMAQEV